MSIFKSLVVCSVLILGLTIVSSKNVQASSQYGYTYKFDNDSDTVMNKKAHIIWKYETEYKVLKNQKLGNLKVDITADGDIRYKGKLYTSLSDKQVGVKGITVKTGGLLINKQYKQGVLKIYSKKTHKKVQTVYIDNSMVVYIKQHR